ncbi:MAG TPA: hypothetical protein DCR59_00845 [Dehalococcoidia bacterium]|nr:hypothetical protein [Dehalococcoidia bacterium]
MPGYDGTGPRGMGPMSGGGRGFCVVLKEATESRSADEGQSEDYTNPVSSIYEQEEEIDALKSEMKSLKDTLIRIESQIAKLAK